MKNIYIYIYFTDRDLGPFMHFIRRINCLCTRGKRSVSLQPNKPFPQSTSFYDIRFRSHCCWRAGKVSPSTDQISKKLLLLTNQQRTPPTWWGVSERERNIINHRLIYFPGAAASPSLHMMKDWRWRISVVLTALFPPHSLILVQTLNWTLIENSFQLEEWYCADQQDPIGL